uniref:MFS domain-containing protein n=1 Tax=Caenorhabditis tropicalis TaxID=1561998 RepID=A0A1I7U826_9PELO
MKVVPIDQNFENPSNLTPRLLGTSVISTLAGGFHFGYLISAVNPLSDILQQFIVENLQTRYSIELSSSQLALLWSSLAGCLFVGAMIGAYLSVSILPKIGPRKTLLLAATILLFSTPVFGLAYSLNFVELLPISRIISGIGFAIGISAQGVFLTEITPVKYRGLTNSLSGLIGNIAFLLAASLGTPYLLGTESLWKYIFLVETIPCVVHIVLNILFFHESPNHLISIGKPLEAEESLKAYHGRSCHVKKILEELRNSDNGMKEKSLREILKDKACSQALSLSVAVNFAVAFSGIAAISFFGTFLLQNVGFSPEGSAVANSLCSFAAIISALLAAITIDKVGRRPLLISSLLVLALINILMMALVFLYDSTKDSFLAWPFLGLFVMFTFVFSIGIGPAAVFIGAELAPPGTISKMQSYSTSVQFIGSFICPIIYLSLVESIGGLAFLLFIVPLTITAAYFYMYLPETKGKTPVEINELLCK